MKRKYYLRGLGFGILITALVFILTDRPEMTDDEIIRRAEQLGYVKAEENPKPSINLNELMEKEMTPVPTPTLMPVPTEIPTPTLTPVPTEIPTPTLTPVPTEIPTPTLTPVPTEMPTPTLTPVPTEIPTPTPELTITPAPEEADIITAQITVERGNTAIIVCNKIANAGIVSDGNGLKNYIVAHGYASDINIGTYTLSSNMSYEEIAKILTGR